MTLEDCCNAAAAQDDPSLLGACPSDPEPVNPTPPVDPDPEDPVIPEGLETIESMVCFHEVFESMS